MAIATRENAEIKGTKLGEEETKLLQFSDDTNSALVLFKLLESFNTYLG